MENKLKNCPACSKEVAKSAKVCPNCGKKLKMGWFLKVIIGIVVLIVIGIFLKPSKEDRAKELDELAKAEVSDISPAGELAAIFKLDSTYTDLQREKTEKEINGKIVQWTLPVFENKADGECYRIQTSADHAIFGGNPLVGTFISIYPRNENERVYIENLKTGDMITFKGKIAGTTMRYIDIRPAILMSSASVPESTPQTGN